MKLLISIIIGILIFSITLPESLQQEKLEQEKSKSGSNVFSNIVISCLVNFIKTH